MKNGEEIERKMGKIEEGKEMPSMAILPLLAIHYEPKPIWAHFRLGECLKRVCGC
jgi:hypothetical protein